ncbi:hypothetical protein N7U49_13140 [Streptomyces sp. AD2-2]|nr:hypothetical protein N7U49_13140 [Streptomyces sp. AD2-2]
MALWSVVPSGVAWPVASVLWPPVTAGAWDADSAATAAAATAVVAAPLRSRLPKCAVME